MVGRRKMLNLMLGCCKVYISESRNKTALETIELAGKIFPEVAIANKFEDGAYNRVGYTLVSKLPPKPFADSCALRGAAFSMVRAALEVIDFNKHCGSHSRLGIIYHICFHPLDDTSMDQVVDIAKSLASKIGFKLSVPIFLYGAAHEGRKLDSIRRELGYFKPNAQGNLWVGDPQRQTMPLQPEERTERRGPNERHHCDWSNQMGRQLQRPDPDRRHGYSSQICKAGKRARGRSRVHPSHGSRPWGGCHRGGL